MAEPNGADLIVAESRKAKETANRIANGESPKSGAEDVRVLAGLVHQIAEQVERLAEMVRTGTPQAEGHTSAEEVADTVS
jgi:hypothetical protein